MRWLKQEGDAVKLGEPVVELETEKVSYELDATGRRLKYADIMPRCHGEVAMADAIIALTANMAMAKKERIVFEEAWFDANSSEVPETKHGKAPAPAKA